MLLCDGQSPPPPPFPSIAVRFVLKLPTPFLPVTYSRCAVLYGYPSCSSPFAFSGSRFRFCAVLAHEVFVLFFFVSPSESVCSMNAEWTITGKFA